MKKERKKNITNEKNSITSDELRVTIACWQQMRFNADTSHIHACADTYSIGAGAIEGKFLREYYYTGDACATQAVRILHARSPTKRPSLDTSTDSRVTQIHQSVLIGRMNCPSAVLSVRLTSIEEWWQLALWSWPVFRHACILNARLFQKPCRHALSRNIVAYRSAEKAVPGSVAEFTFPFRFRLLKGDIGPESGGPHHALSEVTADDMRATGAEWCLYDDWEESLADN